MAILPEKQHAVQLVGPGTLRLNTSKEVPAPGPHHIVAKIEVTGLCFSDLKLLHQFSAHPRKGPIVSGLTREVLSTIPSYVPGEIPTVPGHESCCRIVAVGKAVKHHKVGERCLIQADYRPLGTAGSNAAFGYNFEGALQEYVLMDERVVMDPASGERFLIPVPEDLSASSVALVEPWACVEDSYVNVERRTVRKGGRMLVVAAAGADVRAAAGFVTAAGAPAALTVVAGEKQLGELKKIHPNPAVAANLADLPAEAFDDILYFGADAAQIEALNGKLAPRGIFAIMLGGKKIGRPASIGLGRVHYGMTRWVGTTGSDPAEAYAVIPETGEVRRNDAVAVVGAAGPMGQMHVIRTVCSGVPGITVTCADIDDARMASMMKKAEPMAQSRTVTIRTVNTSRQEMAGTYDYFAIMVPAGGFVAEAVRKSNPGCLINIFAGIPAPTLQEIDLDTYIANRCFMFGTSGSVIRDMKIVLEKLSAAQLDTDCSVDAICGMAGAIEGLEAVEKRTLSGKIIVYPSFHDMGLIPLVRLKDTHPTVAAKLVNGQWNREAEQELLKLAPR